MPTFEDFDRIVSDGRPLIDVRAPVEFAKGAFPNAVNLPLMDDDERHQVGKCYKQRGSEEAVKLGYELVAGAVKEQRVEAWLEQLRREPSSLLYCFRGGMRSQIAQRWIYEASGRWVPRLAGGYKVFRNFLLQALDPNYQAAVPVLIGGYTGSGKTILLNKFANAVDLEGLANHRGSAFGRNVTEQPAQIDFENQLAYTLIHIKQRQLGSMLLEDEGSHIGRCYLPKPLVQYFGSGDFLLLQVPLSQRVEITAAEYVHDAQQAYKETYGETEGMEQWSNYIRSSLTKLRKRLGPDRYGTIMDFFERALAQQLSDGRSELHNCWVKTLLEEYYDPMYRYQLQNKKDRITFAGNPEEITAYINDHYEPLLQKQPTGVPQFQDKVGQ